MSLAAAAAAVVLHRCALLRCHSRALKPFRKPHRVAATGPHRRHCSSSAPKVVEYPSVFDENDVPALNLVVCNGETCDDQLTFFLKRATRVFCADGGSNTLRRFLLKQQQQQAESLRDVPTTVVGDFDSASPDTLAWFAERGSTVRRIEDQNRTDLEKALGVLGQESQAPTVVLGAMDGRLDHYLGNFNVLFKFSESFEQLRLVSAANTAQLLPADVVSRLHRHPEFESRTCGLIPIGGPAQSVWTTGLLYNLAGDSLAYGDMVSSCNTIVDNDRDSATESSAGRQGVVSVQTSSPLLWTVSLEDR